MDEKLNQKPVVPPPPEPEISIRTMDSDIKTLGQSGGETVSPEIIQPPPAESQFDIPGYTGPEKPIFSPTAPIIEETKAPLKESKWKFIAIIIGISVIIIIFGLLGYFVIPFWFFPKEMPAVQ